MREMHLFYEGNPEGEKRAADLVQEAVFNVLRQEGMDVKAFVNRAKESRQKLEADGMGRPELKIPSFMKRNQAAVNCRQTGGR